MSLKQFSDLFVYRDKYDEHMKKDKEFYDCMFLKDFYPYKKNDFVNKIVLDWFDLSLTIEYKHYAVNWKLDN